MFFNLPPLSCGEKGKECEVSFFSSREVTDADGGSSLHIDIANVVTNASDDDARRVTHFGIQGRSDHLMDLLGQGGKEDKPASA